MKSNFESEKNESFGFGKNIKSNFEKNILSHTSQWQLDPEREKPR
jgi:hypothetical protein